MGDQRWLGLIGLGGGEERRVSQLCAVITVSILSETQKSWVTPRGMAINLGCRPNGETGLAPCTAQLAGRNR